MGSKNHSQDKQATLEQTLAEQTRKLNALYDVLEVASKLDDLQLILERSLRRVLAAACVDVGAIHLIDPNGRFLECATQQGLQAEPIAQFDKLPLDDSLVGWVYRQQQVLLVDNIWDDPRTAVVSAQHTLKAYVGIPIKSSDKVWGVLSVMAEDKTVFTEPDIDLLSSLTDQLGVTIENATLRQQNEQLAVLHERNRLARELHDSVTQSLYSLTLFAEASKRTAATGQIEKTIAYLEEVSETAQQALKEMRLLVYKLRPSILAQQGLVPALQHRLNAVEGRAGMKHQLQANLFARLGPAVEDALFFICQEALNNALKHAQATDVLVRLEQQDDGQLELTIADNGRGFDPETAVHSGGMGLTTMRERAEQFGGTITYQSEKGQGTKIKITFTELTYPLPFSLQPKEIT